MVLQNTVACVVRPSVVTVVSMTWQRLSDVGWAEAAVAVVVWLAQQVVYVGPPLHLPGTRVTLCLSL